jgi:hypothetical protein
VSPQASAYDNLAIRLTFSYQGRKVALQSRQHLRMKAPPTDRIDEYEKQSGAWIELRDDKQRVLYRRVLHNLIPDALEAPSGDPARSFTRVHVEPGKGVFSIVVPDLAMSARILLYDGPAEGRDHEAKCVADIDLKKSRK